MREKLLPVLITVIAILAFGNLVVLDIKLLKQSKESITTPLPSVSSATTSDSCGTICQQMIDEKISQAVSTISGKETIKETKVVEKTAGKTSQPGVIYIPLGGGGSTTSRDWADVGNAAVYFDLKDYPNFSEARFEGFIKVLNGNGKVYARLYDATHGIGVQGSDIEASGENFALVSSDKLNFWQGKNLYRIQIKSLNGYEAAVDSGRIKLILK